MDKKEKDEINKIISEIRVKNNFTLQDILDLSNSNFNLSDEIQSLKLKKVETDDIVSEEAWLNVAKGMLNDTIDILDDISSVAISLPNDKILTGVTSAIVNADIHAYDNLPAALEEINNSDNSFRGFWDNKDALSKTADLIETFVDDTSTFIDEFSMEAFKDIGLPPQIKSELNIKNEKEKNFLPNPISLYQGKEEAEARDKTNTYEKDIIKLVRSYDYAVNTFDIFFELTTGDEISAIDTFNKLPESLLTSENRLAPENPILLSARVQSISIPPIKKDTYSFSFCGSNITMDDNKFDEPHQSSFSIRADQSLFWIDLFNQFSGNDSTSHHSWYSSVIKSYQEKGIQQSQLNVNMAELPYMSITSLQHLLSPKKGTLSIYVRKKKNTTYLKAAASETSLHSSEGNTIYIPEVFKFENVKILGTSDSIEFTRDTSDPKVFNFDFIYRDCYRVEL